MPALPLQLGRSGPAARRCPRARGPRSARGRGARAAPGSSPPQPPCSIRRPQKKLIVGKRYASASRAGVERRADLARERRRDPLVGVDVQDPVAGRLRDARVAGSREVRERQTSTCSVWRRAISSCVGRAVVDDHDDLVAERRACAARPRASPPRRARRARRTASRRSFRPRPGASAPLVIASLAPGRGPGPRRSRAAPGRRGRPRAAGARPGKRSTTATPERAPAARRAGRAMRREGGVAPADAGVTVRPRAGGDGAPGTPEAERAREPHLVAPEPGQGAVDVHVGQRPDPAAGGHRRDEQPVAADGLAERRGEQVLPARHAEQRPVHVHAPEVADDADGGPRRREVDRPLVDDVDAVAVIAREAGDEDEAGAVPQRLAGSAARRPGRASRRRRAT